MNDSIENYVILHTMGVGCEYRIHSMWQGDPRWTIEVLAYGPTGNWHHVEVCDTYRQAATLVVGWAADQIEAETGV